VFLDLDASSTLNLQLNAGANITKETGKNAAVQDAGVNGCVDVSAALNVNAGATGSLFDIFNAQTTANLFSKNFDLFQVFWLIYTRCNPWKSDPFPRLLEMLQPGSNAQHN
jgi:hypothetical protein